MSEKLELHQAQYDDGSWSRVMEPTIRPRRSGKNTVVENLRREQVEPSDAQVQAAMSAARAVYIANGWVLSAPHAEEEDAMRAALRAVWGHGENNRGEAAAVSSALWASLKGHVPTDEQMGNAYLAAGYRRVAEVGQAVHDG